MLDAMCDYLRLAPSKVRDEVLELILWNKAPVELQREIEEITVGSVLELLHKLSAESTLQERECWLKETGGHTCKGLEKETTEKTTASPRNVMISKLIIAMNSKHAKFFDCYEKGHAPVQVLSRTQEEASS